MNLNILRKDLFSSLAITQNITSKKTTIAILSNVLIETKNDSIEITGTDLEVGIKQTVSAEILSPGSITLPSRKLFEIIRESDDASLNIMVSENNWAKIEGKSSNYRIAGMPAEEFPSFPEYNEEGLVKLGADIIKKMIDKTGFSIAQEEDNQFALGGALIEKDIGEDGKRVMRMVTSDGHRLSFMEVNVEDDIDRLNIGETTLIPRKGIMEIRRFCDEDDFVYLGFEEKQAVIKKENDVMIIRLMKGGFPKYSQIIDAVDKDKFINVKRIFLLNSMKRINLFAEDLYNIVNFVIEDEKMVLSSQSMDIGSGKEDIIIENRGDPLNVNFNGRYFVDTMHVMNSDDVSLYISSDKSPCMIVGKDDPGFMSIIMPMKV
ncbi:MAG: DNA polymerase III subunit beta [Desulfobulbaceae bacterium]|nr:DNA polymerase III subunit beta [Desulfobulbaceae bacterium]MCK5322779.1 DNA polymerase III subunit beta [Desulfobulbaceae bacterium]